MAELAARIMILRVYELLVSMRLQIPAGGMAIISRKDGPWANVRMGDYVPIMIGNRASTKPSDNNCEEDPDANATLLHGSAVILRFGN